MRLCGKLNNVLNHHNSGCVSDKVVILVLGYGFRSRPI